MSKFLKITSESRSDGGWCEIGVRDIAGTLVAVVTHPCTGAAWFVHMAGKPYPLKKRKFSSRRKALAEVMVATDAEGFI
jgi:hypothetical protein